MNLADNLKKIRKDNNLSQEQLAEKLGVSRQSVSKWESNLAYPEMDKVLQICQMFNLNIDELLNQDIKDVKETKESKSNLNKFIDDFLNYITKTFDMFSSMKFKAKIKCIFEQLILIILLIIFFMIFGGVLDVVLDKFLNAIDLPYYFIHNLLEALYILFSLVSGILLYLHIFKIRYLDYYTVVKNKTYETGDKLKTPDKPETIIIRDIDHSDYRFIKGLLKLTLLILKGFGIFAALLLLFILVLQTITLTLSFVIIKTGLFFIGLFIFITSTIVLNLVLLYVIYNLIFNKRIDKFKSCITFIISVVVAGISIGIMIISIKDFDYVRDLNSKYFIEEETIIPMRDDILIDDFYKVEFIENNSNDISIKCIHSYQYKFEINTASDGIIYFSTYQDDINLLDMLRKNIEDFNNKKIIDHDEYKIYISTTKENIEKIKSNYSKYYEDRNNYYKDLNNYENKIYELEDEISKKDERINELEDIIENYIKTSFNEETIE